MNNPFPDKVDIYVRGHGNISCYGDMRWDNNYSIVGEYEDGEEFDGISCDIGWQPEEEPLTWQEVAERVAYSCEEDGITVMQIEAC